jgi:hypothetical protein
MMTKQQLVELLGQAAKAKEIIQNMRHTAQQAADYQAASELVQPWKSLESFAWTLQRRLNTAEREDA